MTAAFSSSVATLAGGAADGRGPRIGNGYIILWLMTGVLITMGASGCPVSTFFGDSFLTFLALSTCLKSLTRSTGSC